MFMPLEVLFSIIAIAIFIVGVLWVKKDFLSNHPLSSITILIKIPFIMIAILISIIIYMLIK